MKSLSIFEHFNSKTHTSFTNSIITRLIILSPNIDEFDKIMWKYVFKQNEKYEEDDVNCLLNLLTTTNRVKYFRIKPQSSLHYSFYVAEK